MNDVKFPNVSESLYKLAQNETDFKLGQSLSQFEKYWQVEAIAVVLNHVDVWRRFNSLVKTHTLFRLYHVVDAYLLRNAVHVFLRNASNFHYLARVNLIDLALNVCCELRFANLSVLADTKYFIYVDQIPIDFSHLRYSSRRLIRQLLRLSYRLDFWLFVFSVIRRLFQLDLWLWIENGVVYGSSSSLR